MNKHAFLESKVYSISSGKPFREEYKDFWVQLAHKCIDPVKTMKGIGKENLAIINESNIPDDDKIALVKQIQKSNRPLNRDIAGLANKIAVNTSMLAGGIVADFVCRTVNTETSQALRPLMDILGVAYYGPIASKVIEYPMRFIVDGVRKSVQEDNTRRFLDSEGIR